MRKEMSGGALLAQLSHACSEVVTPEWAPLPKDTRAVILSATKDQLEQLIERLAYAALFESAGPFHHAVILETDGVLAGVATAVGILTRDRDALREGVPMLRELRPWR